MRQSLMPTPLIIIQHMSQMKAQLEQSGSEAKLYAWIWEVIVMEKNCHLCGKELNEDDEYQFFPEDDSYICKDCLCKAAKK